MPANESGQENKMKKYVRLVVLAIIAVALITTVLGGFYRVDEQEAAVVTMFGKVVRTDTAGRYSDKAVHQAVNECEDQDTGQEHRNEHLV